MSLSHSYYHSSLVQLEIGASDSCSSFITQDFLFCFALVILIFLCLHMKMKVDLAISEKLCYFDSDFVELVDYLWYDVMVVFILILPSHVHGRSFPCFMFF